MSVLSHTDLQCTHLTPVGKNSTLGDEFFDGVTGADGVGGGVALPVSPFWMPTNCNSESM